MADRITNEQREAIVRKAVAERDAMLTDKADERGSAEPVARVVRRWPHYNLGVELISERPVKEGDQLYLRSDSAQARDAAMEEAAKACEGRESMDADACAAAIRALKGKP
jgi:hypothetical protein